ncbi:protoglobin domain-containing protein [Carbonactinospora thermoautotrophica]|uniref:protoglobin domain-containing protein n=1 Tax=Carbonactinospora thermoautotrophica TaxID=1469144 RepID=UPI003DA906F2
MTNRSHAFKNAAKPSSPLLSPGRSTSRPRGRSTHEPCPRRACLAGRRWGRAAAWYGYVGSHPHLVHYFAGPDGKPIDEYLARVRSRFEQWVRDLCQRPRDRAWLDYQEEIALRHTRTKKNHTDGVEAAPEIPLRYMIAFIYPITATIREFLAAKGDPEETVEAMYQAWFKSVVLSMTLWARPYVEQRW